MKNDASLIVWYFQDVYHNKLINYCGTYSPPPLTCAL